MLEDSSKTPTAQTLDSAAEKEPSAATVVTVPLEHILMPAARHLSQSKGVDATGLKGTGKGGRVTKGDVLQALSDGIELPLLDTNKVSAKTVESASPASVATIAPTTTAPPVMKLDDVVIPSIASSGTYEDVQNNNMRKVIAKRLTESKSTARPGLKKNLS